MLHAVLAKAGGTLVSVVTSSNLKLRWGVFVVGSIVSFCFLVGTLLSPSLGLSGAGGVFCLVATSGVLESVVLLALGSVVGLWCRELARFYCSDQLHLRCEQVICGV